MASVVVVDTDLIIDFLSGKGPGVGLVRDLLVARRLRLTAISAFELRFGTDFHTRHDEIMRLFRSRTLPLDIGAAVRAGEVASDLRRRGEPIGSADSMQAGVCLRHGLPFATRNRKHFERVAGLELIDVD